MDMLNLNSTLFYLLIIWSVIWKSIELWHEARNKQLAWFIALIVINTAGVLEVLYLIFFRKNRGESQ